MSRPGVAASLALLLAACRGAPAAGPGTEPPYRLPTGALLDPVVAGIDVGSFPLALAVAPGGKQAVLLLNGYREQGIQVVDLATGTARPPIEQPAGFLGLAFDHKGTTLYASGGNQDVVYRYAWHDGAPVLQDSLLLSEPGHPERSGRRYPAGLALSPDDHWLLVAENLSDSLALVDTRSGVVRSRVPAGRYPYGVAVSDAGAVYVSAWGGFALTTFRLGDGRLTPMEAIAVGRHPSALLLTRDGSRLFVASASTDRITVVDTRARRVVAQLVDSAPAAPAEGSTPNALALSPDGADLFVAEADNNAVARFRLSPATRGAEGPPGPDRLLGRIPVDWYPTALAFAGESLLVASGKGHGTGPNAANGPGRPDAGRRGYTLGQLSGTLTALSPALLAPARLGALSARVARANGWTSRPAGGAYPPFEHVIYIVKENRSYDQVLGDLHLGDGDTALTYFPREVTPNHHALAERFGVFDRFFVNAEVSADGHNWTVGAYATDYVEKTTPSTYSGRGRSYDYEGENRGARPAEGQDAAEPASGYLWDLARRRGLSFRNFGEFVRREGNDDDPPPPAYVGLKPFLDQHTDSGFPGFDLDIPDQQRADRWLAALDGWVRSGSMPALQILRLPNDHTKGAYPEALTPRAYLADNDLALGRVIEALSRTPFWRTTVVFVVEDDAQNGPDHVDSHRAPFLLISAWNRPAVRHRFTNTTDVIATIEEILSLDHLSQFDAFGRPLRGVYAAAADLTPYTALRPAVAMDEHNPPRGPAAKQSLRLDFRYEDLADDDLFNRVLWLAIKGPDAPYPGPHVRSPLDWLRGN
jgi:YVTN family beta-propeller protein